MLFVVCKAVQRWQLYISSTSFTALFSSCTLVGCFWPPQKRDTELQSNSVCRFRNRCSYFPSLVDSVTHTQVLSWPLIQLTKKSGKGSFSSIMPCLMTLLNDQTWPTCIMWVSFELILGVFCTQLSLVRRFSTRSCLFSNPLSGLRYVSLFKDCGKYRTVKEVANRARAKIIISIFILRRWCNLIKSALCNSS